MLEIMNFACSDLFILISDAQPDAMRLKPLAIGRVST